MSDEKPIDASKATEGLRFNTGKNRTDLLPFDTIWHIAKVIEAGSKKYADRNWEKGMSWMTVVGCLTRHLIKFATGNDYDRSDSCPTCKTGDCKNHTGLPHIDLVLINAVFLSRYFRMNQDKDDRPIEYCERIND